MPTGKASAPFSIHATHMCSSSPMPGTVLGAGLKEMKGPVSDSKIRPDRILSRQWLTWALEEWRMYGMRQHMERHLI